MKPDKRIKIWNFWAKHYSGLWVQKWMLGPTRKAVIEKISALEKSMISVLDIGCGIGQLANELALSDNVSHVTAIDISPAMIERAKKENASSKIDYQCKVLDEIKGSFDVIVSTHSFPYFPDQALACRQMFQLLKPGGICFVVMAHRDTLYDVVAIAVVKLTTIKAKYTNSSKVTQMLETAGLQVAEVQAKRFVRFSPTVKLISAVRI